MLTNWIDVFERTLEPLSAKQSPIREKIISGLVRMCDALNMTRNIPREYRGTRKDEPTTPSLFLQNLFVPLQEFSATSSSLLSEQVLKEWKKQVVVQVTENYRVIAQETLQNVKSIEESLKRLKKKRVEGMSDEDKIRRQIQLDVGEYGGMVSEYGVDTDKLSELINAEISV
jgi:hypothetical protein